MTHSNDQSGAGGSRRRQILTTGLGAVGMGAASALLPVRRAWAGAEKKLKIGFISPRTGPLAGFGEADPFVLNLARQSLAKGLTIGGNTYEVVLLDRDTQSDPTRASQLAKDLINGEKIDMMLTTSTPEVVNPVADACEAAGMPCLSTIEPWESWYFGRGAKPGQPCPFKWSYHFCFGVEQFAQTYLSSWNSDVKTNRKVAGLAPNDADGNAVRQHLYPILRKAGFDVIDPGGYEDGATDFSAQIAHFKREKCEILTTFPIPPDFTRFWRQAAQQGLTRQMKIVEVAKTGLFPSQIEVLGPLGYRIAAAAYWHPVFPYGSPVSGLTSAQLAASYEKHSGHQWQQQLGASMSLIDAGVAALQASGAPTNKVALAAAMGKLKTTTTVGLVDFTTGPVPHVATTILIGAQWVKSKPGSKYKLDYHTIENAEDHKVPVQAKLLPYRMA